MSRLTLILEIINTVVPLGLIWAILEEDWGMVIAFTCVILFVQIIGLGSYLKDYKEWR
jgi:hypothetical protein